MKKVILSLIISLSVIFVHGNNIINNRIDHVTVYNKGALVKRTLNLQLSKGNNQIVIKKLSPYIDPGSIQVKSTVGQTILLVEHETDHSDSLQKNEQISTLQKQITILKQKIESYHLEKEILNDKISFLQTNKSITGDDASISPEVYIALSDAYNNRIAKYKTKTLHFDRKLKAAKERIARLKKQITSIDSSDDTPPSAITLKIKSDYSTTAQMEITYMVRNAGWFPAYDIRVDRLDEPLELVYKAKVYQNTGIEWKDVRLSFSNASPSRSGNIPSLQKWSLSPFSTPPDYSLQGIVSGLSLMKGNNRISGYVYDNSTNEPLIGATITVKGTTIGTVSDVNGRFDLSIPSPTSTVVVNYIGYLPRELSVKNKNSRIGMTPDISSLEEVVVVGYGSQKKSSLTGSVSSVNIRGNSTRPQPDKKYESRPVASKTIRKKSSVEFSVNELYTVKSNNKKKDIVVKKHLIGAEYEHQCVPKIDQDVFLVARLADWEKYHLLDGEANLYFENTYVGKSALNLNSVNDTLNISLGRDHGITVKREKESSMIKNKSFAGNKINDICWKITAKNNKQIAVKLRIFDQIPVSIHDDIKVELITDIDKNGKLNSHNGMISYDMDIKPLESKEQTISYSVKYPQYMNLVLE
jgi:hypothetical protein